MAETAAVGGSVKKRANRGAKQEKPPRIPGLRDPVMVCGLPGSGFVGKLGADQIISVFHAEKIAEYRRDDFPPQVNVKDDGTAEPLKAELYLAKTEQAHDIFVFTADAQPATSEGEYELSDEIITFAKEQGVKTVYTLAAYITGAFAKAPKVYGSGTSKEMLSTIARGGATLMKDGGITGMNGLVIGMAELHGLSGACLLGETSGYVIDAGASKAVIEVLGKVINVSIDTASLGEKAEETRKLISQLQAMAEQSREASPAPTRETRPGYIS
jgi:uncharacterized protein (TIGR00162 family)